MILIILSAFINVHLRLEKSDGWAVGIMGARRVAETISHKITAMNPGQGLSANFATGILVSFASFWGLPVSTTHVSVGALSGIGLVNRKANSVVIRNVVMSWIATLPCAAVLGAAVYGIINTIG